MKVGWVKLCKETFGRRIKFFFEIEKVSVIRDYRAYPAESFYSFVQYDIGDFPV